MPDPRDPTRADFELFIDTHGDETWFLGPILEESECPHRVDTWVPYGDTEACSARGEVCGRCVVAESFERAETLYGEGLISFDPTNTYLEYTP